MSDQEYNSPYNIVLGIKGIHQELETHIKTNSTTIDQDGVPIVVGDNSTYYQVDVIVSDNEPTGLNSSTDVGTVWYDTLNDTVKWWDGFIFQNYTPGQNWRGGIGLEALGPAVLSRIQSSLDLYYQSTAPGAPVINMLWKDTDDNVLYRYDGTSFQVVTDDNIETAVTTALTSEGVDLTDNFLRIYYQAAAPTGQGATSKGNLWFDSDDDFNAYSWNGTEWVAWVGDIRVIPVEDATDGVPPGFSPIPTVYAGFGSYFIGWDEVPNNDLIAYDIYMSQTNPVPVNTNNFIGTSMGGTFFFTNRDPLGNELVDGATWYFAIIARDPDGVAPISASVGATALKKIVSTEITDGSISTPKLASNAITTALLLANDAWIGALRSVSLSGEFITGAIVRTSTSATTNGVQMSAAGLFGYSGGVQTFGITNTGVVTVKGSITSGSTITGASITGTTITGGTITGATIKTAVSGTRCEILTNGEIWFYGPTGSVAGTIVPLGFGSGGMQITGGGNTLTWSNGGLQANGTLSVSGILSTSVGVQVGGWLYTNDIVNLSGSTITVRANMVMNNNNNFTGIGQLSAQQVFATNPSVVSTTPDARFNATTGQIQRTTGSAAKYKENIRDADIDLAALLQMRVRNFTYKEDYFPGGELQVGLIADELEALGLTHWVEYDDNGELENVAYSKLCVPLIALCQRQQEQIDYILARLGERE